MRFRTVFFAFSILMLSLVTVASAGGRRDQNGGPGDNGAVQDTLIVEGAVMMVDLDADVVVLQTDEGLTDTISITDQTVFEEGADLEALVPGQRLRFHYIELEDRRVATRVEVIEPANGGNGRNGGNREEEW